MRTSASVILLEFNELTPYLMDRFMGEGKLPNFHRLYSEAQVYTSDAQEAPPYLNPWIQWVTVHCGLSYEEHGIYYLNEAYKLGKQCIWDILSEKGFRVWVCGSMNVRYDVPLNGYILPDPWTLNAEPYPKGVGLEDFCKFVQTQVQEHTNEKVPLTKADYARFLSFMVRHGLSVSTVSAIVKQLAKERVGIGKWKRAVILDKLTFDVFRSVYKRHKPHFSTFFSNSVAHFQHCYWRNMDPESFKVKPSQEEQAEYGGAVLFAYKEMDKTVGKFLDLAGDDVTLVFSTALSQKPCLRFEEIGGKSFYRPKDFDKVVRFAGITAPHKSSPVMSEQFHVYFDAEKDADAAAARLRELRVNGRPLMGVEREDSKVIFTGANIFDGIPRDAVLTAESGRSVSFFDLFYQADTLKSGMHHPDGALWIRYPDRQHFVCKEKVSLCSVAPTILEMFSVPRPDFMTCESLV